MKYEQTTGQTTFIQPSTVENFKKKPEIRRTRLVLLILLLVDVVQTVATNLYDIVIVTSHNTVLNDSYKDGLRESVTLTIYILTVIISLIYYITFIIIVIRYSLRGIRIFAWLHMIELTWYLISNFLKVAAIFSNSFLLTNIDHGTDKTVIRTIGFLENLLVSVLIIFFAFKLVKLIKSFSTSKS